MTTYAKKYLYGAALLPFVAFLVLAFANEMEAAIYLLTPKKTATATTTVAYMTPGTATTTLTSDLYFSSSNTKASGALVAFQYTASSSAAALKARVEYSDDGIDWYPESVELNTVATTTLMTTTFREYSWSNFATTTDYGGSGTASRIHQSFSVETPTRYVRVKFYVPAGAGNGALWASLTPNKEN